MAKKASKAAVPDLKDKVGRFTIPAQVLDDEPDIVRRIMGECIILRAEFILSEQSVVFDARHDDFEVREKGADVQVYNPVYDTEKDVLNWEKVE